MNLGAIAMKWCSAFPKAPASQEPHHQIIMCYVQDICSKVGGSYPSVEVQSVYSKAPADWGINFEVDT